jgi:hypothetical protein
MTFLRSDSDPGRGGERIVATLRRELLAPVDAELTARHLEVMLLELDWERSPAPADRRPKLRVPRVVGTCVAAAALSLTGGLAAAGALPATAQHWISRVTHIVGIPLPDAPVRPDAPLPSRTGAPRPPQSPASTARIARLIDSEATKTVVPAVRDWAAGPTPGGAAVAAPTAAPNASEPVPVTPQPTPPADTGTSSGDNGSAGNGANDGVIDGNGNGTPAAGNNGKSEDQPAAVQSNGGNAGGNEAPHQRPTPSPPVAPGSNVGAGDTSHDASNDASAHSALPGAVALAAASDGPTHAVFERASGTKPETNSA